MNIEGAIPDQRVPVSGRGRERWWPPTVLWPPLGIAWAWTVPGKVAHSTKIGVYSIHNETWLLTRKIHSLSLKFSHKGQGSSCVLCEVEACPGLLQRPSSKSLI